MYAEVWKYALNIETNVPLVYNGFGFYEPCNIIPNLRTKNHLKKI